VYTFQKIMFNEFVIHIIVAFSTTKKFIPECI
jgi:hypothetical protein